MQKGSTQRSPEIMGILNVTPDSFSDGGLFMTPTQALQGIEQLFKDGTHLVDIGAESTRPGALPLSPQEEWARLEPVLQAIKYEDLVSRISLDSRHDENILKAYKLGVRFFNNIAGLYQDETMRILAQDHKTRYCAMHMHRSPIDMQLSPLSEDNILETMEHFFTTTRQKLLDYGFLPQHIYLDPGIGFGKTDAANLALIENARGFSSCYNLLYGISRKSFIGRVFEINQPKDRDGISKAYEIALIHQGAKIIRTHNVRMLRSLLKNLGKLDGGVTQSI